MIIRACYTLLLLLAAPLLLYGLYKKKPNKPVFGARWKEHFGLTPRLNTTSRPLWIHAVSVGECIAATPMIKAIKKRYPDLPVLVTTTTSTGAQQIAQLGDLVEHRYMPLDFSFAVRMFLNRVRPSRLLIIETELWPNTLATVARQNIPITVVNARLSEKSCRNYQKVRWLFNEISRHLSLVLCQSEEDKQRFLRLGMTEDKLAVTGSIKFDIQISDEIKAAGKALKQEIGKHRPVWIAASTHEGEDQPLLTAHAEVTESCPDALLILVPRHPERFDEVYELCQQMGLKTARRSHNDAIAQTTQVYLGDTMGEMLLLMGASDACFMGGSLIGKKVGGHNVLEPLALHLPTCTGPSYYNFQQIVDELLAQNAITVLQSAAELPSYLLTTLKSDKNPSINSTFASMPVSPIDTTLAMIFSRDFK